MNQLVIITGISGAGKSSALDALEDLGYFCVDNLPAPIIPSFIDYVRKDSSARRYGLLVDCREEEAAKLIVRELGKLDQGSLAVKLIFLDCQDDVALRRYQVTRRPHPLLLSSSKEGSQATLQEALSKEREILAELRAAATQVYDTSTFTPHELRAAIEQFLGEKARLEIKVLSFGYKFGVPSDVDLVCDVRFLPNPHFVDELREKTGCDLEVSDYVLKSPESQQFLEKYQEFLSFLLPRYVKEGKRYLTIAVGCTGGKHRSVAIAEELGKRLEVSGELVSVKHRDKERK